MEHPFTYHITHPRSLSPLNFSPLADHFKHWVCYRPTACCITSTNSSRTNPLINSATATPTTSTWINQSKAYIKSTTNLINGVWALHRQCFLLYEFRCSDFSLSPGSDEIVNYCSDVFVFVKSFSLLFSCETQLHYKAKQ